MLLSYLTALILVFSGMAIGYFLWHRESQQDDALYSEMLRQNDEMKQSLHMAQASYSTLDDRFCRQRSQLGVLQQLCDDWSASREQAHRERTELDVQLTERNKRCNELEAELQSLRKKNVEIEDSLHAATQDGITKIAALENEWRNRHAKADASVTSQVAEIKLLTADNKSRQEELHQARARIAELESELKSHAQALDNTRSTATGLEKETVSLETSLTQNKELLSKTEGQLAAAQSEKESLVEQLAAAKAKNETLQQEVESLEQIAGEIDTHRQNNESLILSLSNANGQLEKVLEQRDSAMSSASGLQTVSRGLQTRIDNQESTIHRLRKCQDDALENLKHELKVRREMESRYDERINELRSQMKSQAREFQKQVAESADATGKQKQDFDAEVEMLHEVAEQEVTELKAKLETAGKEIESLQEAKSKQATELNNFAQLQQQFVERETQLSQLADTIKSNSADYKSTIVKLEAHREQLSKELETARDQLQSQLKKDSETIGKVQAQRDSLQEEVNQLTAKASQLQEAVTLYEQSRSEQETQLSQLAQTRARLCEVEKSLAKKDQSLRHLQAESAELSRLRDEHSISLRRQAELQSRLDSMMADHLATQKLREQIRQQQQTIENLQASQDTEPTFTMNENPTVIPFTQAIQHHRESTYDSTYGGRVRRDHTLGIVFTEAPEACDDLKRISGIATVLENRLNEIGIYTFKQIIDWKPEEIEEFSRVLAFRDRIERDDWQGQARFFYNQKENAQRQHA